MDGPENPHWPPPGELAVQDPADIGIPDLAPIGPNYYTDVHWFKFVILTAIFEIILITSKILSWVVLGANVAFTLAGYVLWILIIPIFALSSFTLIGLTFDRAIMKWVKHVDFVYILLSGGFCVSISGAAWYDHAGTYGVGMYNGFFMTSLIVFYIIACLVMHFRQR